MSCPDCISGSVLSGEPTGQFLPDGSYFASAPPSEAGAGTPDARRRAVVLFTDVFGLPLKNSKILADTFAQRLRCDVYVPDYFAGRPPIGVDQLKIQRRAFEKRTLMDWLQMIWAFMVNVPNLYRSRESVVDSRVNKFLKETQERENYSKIGVVGYCFGGSTAVRFGSSDWISSIVVVHPGPVSIQQVQAIKVPASWVCAEDDLWFADKKRLEVEAQFAGRKENKVDYEFVVHKGTAHGFGSRPDLDIPEIKTAWENAMSQIVGWFEKTL